MVTYVVKRQSLVGYLILAFSSGENKNDFFKNKTIPICNFQKSRSRLVEEGSRPSLYAERLVTVDFETQTLHIVGLSSWILRKITHKINFNFDFFFNCYELSNR